MRSSNGFSVTNTMPALELLVKPLIDRPGNGDGVLDARLLQRDVAHAADHLLGAVERGAVGQLREADQVLLVLRRHEAAGHDAGTAPAVDADQHERRRTIIIALREMTPVDAAAVAVGAAIERRG